MEKEDKEQPFPEISEEVKKKLEVLKTKVESFKKKVLKEFNKNIIGISLLPPNKEKKDDINVLVMIEDPSGDNVEEYMKKIYDGINKIAKDADKSIKPQITTIMELKEMCFDGKYEILQLIAMSAIVYDKGLLVALKVSEIHKTMALKKFEKYIVSYVAVGSSFRGDSNPNDIDVAIVVDDTDVKKMSRMELKDKLGAIIRSMGAEASKIAGVKAQFHVQTYILTDFWDSVKDANPVIFTFLRDGVPLYDRGVFMPWKLLLKMGRIKPSAEAIEMQMDVGEKLIQRIRYKMLSVVGEDLYYAILNPAQAALMLYGIAPPTPKETIVLLDKILVKQEKLLEKKYVDILENIRKYYKDIEHGKVKEIKGKDIDNLLENAEDYLKRIKKLFKQIEERKEKENIVEMYDTSKNVVNDVLKMNNVKKIDNITLSLKKELVDKGKIPEKLFNIFKTVERVKKENKKLSSQELEKIKKDYRIFVKWMFEYVQRKRGFEIERARIRFKYGDKYGDVLLLNDVAYIIDDIDAEDKKVLKGKIKDDGGLKDLQESNIKELEKHLGSIAIPEKVFIKEKIFEDLRKKFGKDIEILVNY